MTMLPRHAAVITAALCLAAAATSTHAQAPTPIFIDDFENGTANTGIRVGAPETGARWLTVSSGAGTSVEAGTFPNYQPTTATFGSGTLYMRLYDPDIVAGPRVVTSNPAGTDNRESLITNMVTTYSFDFLETSTLPTVTGGTGFGYSNAEDFSSLLRVYRGFMRNGNLVPDSLKAGEGGQVAYAKDTKNTVWMIANDSEVAMENYRGEQTLDAKSADVWISLAGAEPIFAFAVNKQNAATAPQGVGFRSFTGDLTEVLVDNVLLLPGATFDRTAFNAPPGPNANFDELGTVDAADLTKWRTGFPKATAAVHMDGDANADADVDGNDFLVWQRQLGTTPAAGAALAAVPEPSATLLGVAVAASIVAMRRRIAR